ncbi:MAG: hypothetical protein JRI84_16570 [Deltaproteobacteria bacterium]|nr:hypothetical protein [Deltaproteobacteria bacterium]
MMKEVYEREATIRRLKNRGYKPAGKDKMGEYFQNGHTLVYVDHIGIFVYRQPFGQNGWNREAGYTFYSIPWEYL